jgi:hypothetical protein
MGKRLASSNFDPKKAISKAIRGFHFGEGLLKFCSRDMSNN